MSNPTKHFYLYRSNRLNLFTALLLMFGYGISLIPKWDCILSPGQKNEEDIQKIGASEVFKQVEEGPIKGFNLKDDQYIISPGQDVCVFASGNEKEEVLDGAIAKKEFSLSQVQYMTFLISKTKIIFAEV